MSFAAGSSQCCHNRKSNEFLIPTLGFWLRVRGAIRAASSLTDKRRQYLDRVATARGPDFFLEGKSHYRFLIYAAKFPGTSSGLIESLS